MKLVKNTYRRLNIAKKLLLGYLSLAVLIIIISVFVLSGLERINNINKSIIKTCVPLIEATDKMIDSLLAQELYAHRYAILRSPDMLGLFWQRSEEFIASVNEIGALPDTKSARIGALNVLHEEYNNIFNDAIKNLKRKSTFFLMSMRPESRKNRRNLSV